MKKKYYSLLLIFTFFLAISTKVEARTESATLPLFDVTLNGQKVDNTYSQYPLLVYKDITYFPMTYNTSRFLGLETNWNAVTGLGINKTGVAGKFDFYNTNTRNNSSYQVAVPTFPITVNGKTIDNSKEMYPLLIFRDITYFPMTWRFGVEEFGWDYDFTQARGLVINAKRVENVKQPEKVFTDYSKTEFYNGNYYVVKTDGTNYRLFKDAYIGGKSEQVSDMEIKSFVRDGEKLFFVSGNIYYSYDMKTGRIAKEADVSKIDNNAARVLTIGNETYYVNVNDQALYNSRNERVNNGAKFEKSTKVGNYTIVTFTKMNNADRNQIFDGRGNLIYRTDKEITSANIQNNELVIYLETTYQTNLERVSIR